MEGAIEACDITNETGLSSLEPHTLLATHFSRFGQWQEGRENRCIGEDIKTLSVQVCFNLMEFAHQPEVLGFHAVF